MKKNSCFILLCVFACVLLAGTAVATDYYIDPDPSTTNDGGLDWDNPRRTIAQVQNQIGLSPGDRILIKAGRGNLEDVGVHITTDNIAIIGGFNADLTGTANDLTADRFTNGKTVMDAGGGSRLVMIRQASDQTWDGFQFQNAGTEVAFWIRDDAANTPTGIVIKNCDFINNVVGSYYDPPAFGVSILSGSAPSDFDITVQNCRFENNLNVFDNYYLYGGAVAVEGNTKFIGCTFHKNGIDRLGDGDYDNNQAAFGGSIANLGAHVVIDKCRFTSNTIGANTSAAGGSGVYMTSTAGGDAFTTITNSLFANNYSGTGGARGSIYAHISSDGFLGTPANPAGFIIQNCTFDRNFATGAGAADVHQQSITTTNYIDNSIFSNITGRPVREQNGNGVLNTDYCLFYNNSDWIAGTVNNTNVVGSTDPGDTSAPPNYQNPAAGDWSITDTSSAYDAGKTIVGITKDILGTDRPYGAAFDIGAYEYDPGVNAPPGFKNDPYVEKYNVLVGETYTKTLEGIVDFDDSDDPVFGLDFVIAGHSGPGTGDWLAFNASSAEDVAPTNVIELSGIAADPGVHTWTLRISDGTSSDTAQLSVTVADKNTSPTWLTGPWTATRSVNSAYEQTFTYESDFWDADGDAMALEIADYTGPSASSWLAFGTGTATSLTISGVAPPETGTHVFTLRAVEVDTATRYGDATLTIEVEDPGIIYVNDDATTSAATDGSSWALAFDNLSSATEVALEGDKIWVAGGIYPSDYRSFPSGVSVYGGFAGTEAPDYNLALRDFDTNETRLESDGSLGTNVLFIRNKVDQVYDGLNIHGAFASNIGGGILLRASANEVNENITFSNCKITSNSARYGGGGVCFRTDDNGLNRNITFNNCLFEGNRMTEGTRNDEQGYKGAAMAVAGNTQILRIKNCIFRNNAQAPATVGPAQAGAIGIQSGVTVEIIGCEFYDNWVEDNVFNDSRGGAIFVGVGTAIIRDSIFSGNYADHLGMAIHVRDYLGDGSARAVITNCTFHDNEPPVGFDVAEPADLVVFDQSSDTGAGSASVIKNSVFSSSTGNVDGVRSLSLATGTSTTLTKVYFAGMRTNYRGFYVQPVDVTTTTLTAIGYADAPANDFHIGTVSSLYNAGDNVGVSSVDFEGDPRIVEGTVDIGADEWFDPDAANACRWELYE